MNRINHMAANHVQQADIGLMLNAYTGLLRKYTQEARTQQAAVAANAQASARLDQRTDREVEAQDLRDRNRAEAAVRAKYGYAYQLFVDTVAAYLDRLPAAEREFFEIAEFENGSLALNDVTVLEELYRRAIDSGMSRQEIEHLMKTDRAAYMRHPQAQQHLAAMLRGERPDVVRPKAATSAEQEIRQIEEVMRTQRGRYNRDEAMQSRYRELLRRRG